LRKTGKPGGFYGMAGKAACGNDAFPDPGLKERDMTIQQLLQIETIQFGNTSASLIFRTGKK
jgi:hypothetical protein